MAVSPEYKAYLEEMFAPLSGVSFKRMFGGLGVFHDGAMFALVAYEQLYFKVDKQSESTFSDAESEPFVYEGKGKPIQMSYWTAPDSALDDPEEFETWARLGMEAARRAAAAKPPKKPHKKNA
jgi:DNA transformation protein